MFSSATSFIDMSSIDILQDLTNNVNKENVATISVAQAQQTYPNLAREYALAASFTEALF